MRRIELSVLIYLALSLFCAPGTEIPPEVVTSVSIPGVITRIPLETRAGQIIDPAKVQRDVKTLWNSGQFSDIRVETTPEPTGTRVVFQTQPRLTMRLHNYLVVPRTRGVNLKP